MSILSDVGNAFKYVLHMHYNQLKAMLNTLKKKYKVNFPCRYNIYFMSVCLEEGNAPLMRFPVEGFS